MIVLMMSLLVSQVHSPVREYPDMHMDREEEPCLINLPGDFLDVSERGYDCTERDHQISMIQQQGGQDTGGHISIDWTLQTNWIQYKGYTLEDPESMAIWEDGHARFMEFWQASDLEGLKSIMPVSFLDGRTRVILLSRYQVPFVEGGERLCPSCFQIKTWTEIESSLRTALQRGIQAARMEQPALFPESLTWDRVVIWSEPESWDAYVAPQPLSVLVREHGWSLSWFADAEMLGNRFAHIRVDWNPVAEQTEEVSDIKDGYLTVPRFVAERFNGNISVIMAARKRLQGLTWQEFDQQHGYLPGDRSPLDWQYSFELRTEKTFEDILRSQMPDYFGLPMPVMFWRERRQHWIDTERAGRVDDAWRDIPHTPLDIDAILDREMMDPNLRQLLEAFDPVPVVHD